MHFLFMIIPALLSEIEATDTIPEARIVAERGISVSRTESIPIENSVSITEILNQSTSITVNDNGGFAGLKSASLRGLGSPHTKIYLDGIRVGNVQSGQCDLSMIDLSACSEAVIDYAQNSITFNTAPPSFNSSDIAGNFSISGGAQSSFMSSGRLDFRLSERISLGISASGIYSKGDYLCEDGSRRQNNDIAKLRASIDLFGKTNAGKWHIKAYGNGSNRGAPGSITWPTDDRQNDRNIFIQGSFNQRISNTYDLCLSSKASYDDLFYSSNWGDSRYRQTEFQINSTHVFHLQKWLDLSISADICWDDLISTDCNASRLSPTASVGGSFKVNDFKADLVLHYQGAFDAGSRSINNLCPSLGLGFMIIDGLDISAYCRRDYRIPTFNELYYVGYGNQNLCPEDAILTDLGVKYSEDITDIWHIDAGVNGFLNLLNNKIASAPSPEDPNIWAPYNIGKVRSLGIDISAGASLKTDVWEFILNSSYCWQDAVDITEGSSTFGQQINYVPKHSLSLNASLTYSGWGLISAWNLRADRSDAYGIMPDWNTLDLTVLKRLQLNRCGPLIFKIMGKNITNQHYELSSGYPMPGICLYGGMEFKF